MSAHGRGRSWWWWVAVLLGVLWSAPVSAAVGPAPTKPKTVRPGGEGAKKPAAKPGAKAPAPAKPAAKEATGPAKPKASGAPAPKAAKPRAPGKGTGTAAPAAGAGAASNVRQSEIYGDRLDGLQTEVDGLKDKIFRSRARLRLLKETVLRGVLAGSRVILAHRNLMGSGFRLVRLVFTMDGAQIYARTDETGSLDSEDELTIYDGNLPPGPHNVTIELTYKGHGYGIFSYLSGYTFESRSSHSFTAPENGAVKLMSAGFERGNITTEMRDRPSVDWQEVPLDATGRPLPQTKKRGKARKK